MARKPNLRPPAYTLHKPSGQARVRIHGKDHYLGPYNSPESHDAYARLIAGWSATKPTLLERQESPALDRRIVAELLCEYVEYAKRYYVDPDGRPSKEFKCMIYAMKPLQNLFGRDRVRDFGPVALRTIQNHLIEEGFARTYINAMVNRIRRIFKWGVSRELVAPAIFEALKTVEGLKRGKCKAKESPPTEPVELERVFPVLPLVSRQIGAMIRLQLLCGCRPGEIIQMRLDNIDRTEDVWIFSPEKHKNAYKDDRREIFIGPDSQAIIKEFITAEPHEHLFRPSDAMKEFWKCKRINRTTPLQQGNRPGSNRKHKPKKRAGECYSPESYARAIARACEKAYVPPEPLCRKPGESERAWIARLTPAEVSELKKWRDAHRWSPNQLRHTVGTKIRRVHGLEAAQLILGHAYADVTQVYAERDRAKAIDIVRRCG